jgi:glycosyltransferase involved in cell wall biosynthesis
MRIIIDLQGAQTDSCFRGMGRYTLSLAQAIVRHRGEHEVKLALNGLFPNTIEPIRAAFNGLLPQENIRIWQAPGPVQEIHPGNETRREAAELIREAFLASLEPDVIHISSLFEGYVDDAVTGIGQFDRSTPVSVSLYDLIPLWNPDHYLTPNPRYARYYLRKIEHLKKAAVYLAISEFSRQEGLAHLAGSENSVVNISMGIEPCFQPIPVEEDWSARLRQKFSLTRPFILYTGGADEREMLPRLFQAFALLPAPVREGHQLLLAGRIVQGELAHVQYLAQSAGLKPDELRFTNHVTDEELVGIYNLCHLFVFPSGHEGFGLPLLEAMACGAPVIASNTSSLPEVLGLDEALFDPNDAAAIAARMTWALNDAALRARLREHGLQQAKRFSWDESAKRAIAAWEAMRSRSSEHQPLSRLTGRKPKLAFVSPLPPERTGIADYSAELLPALAEYYDIEVVVEQDRVDHSWANSQGRVRDASWLRAHAGEMDRVLYQMGNSPFHQYMLPLLREVPGTVVLHDFFLSGLMCWLEQNAGAEHAWTRALYTAHGYDAVRARFLDPEAAKRKYPVNLHVFQHARGMIVHSEYSRKLARQWYGKDFAGLCAVIPSLRSPAGTIDKMDSRKQLGIVDEDFVVCTFGFLDATKLNHRLLDCWFQSALARHRRCRLFFVGENQHDDYGASLMRKIRSGGLGDRIRIAGFASPDMFKRYLMAADAAVQLRSCSRGETSAAVLDCMNHALPLIVNAHGTLAELNPEAVWMLPDTFSDAALIAALETLEREPERRRALGERAREIILKYHTPAQCAGLYAEAIERFHRRAETSTPALIAAVAAKKSFDPGDAELIHLARTIAASLPLRRPARRLFLDVTAACWNDRKTGIENAARAVLLALLESPPSGYRIEPVYLSNAGGEWHYRYASRYMLGLLGCPQQALGDETVEPECGDVWFGLDLSGDTLVQAQRSGLFADYRARGVSVVCRPKSVTQ